MNCILKWSSSFIWKEKVKHLLFNLRKWRNWNADSGTFMQTMSFGFAISVAAAICFWILFMTFPMFHLVEVKEMIMRTTSCQYLHALHPYQFTCFYVPENVQRLFGYWEKCGCLTFAPVSGGMPQVTCVWDFLVRKARHHNIIINY